MRIDVLTLFPQMIEQVMNESMMWKARDRGILDLHTHDIRNWSHNVHRQVDDKPFGGGGGMVLKADILVPAVEAVKADRSARVILMSPQGAVFNHDKAIELSQQDDLIFLCGHYEGFDERIRQLVVDEEISIGDYVLTGGELAAMVVIDAVIRQLPGVLGAEEGAARDSHADGLLEGAHYTRPATYRGLSVPDVLRSGNHARVERWRREQSLRRTWQKRPDLLRTAPLDEQDKYFLATLAEESAQQRRDED